MTQPMLDEWETILSLLPANWEQLAHQYEQVETKYGNAKITNAADLLRLILVHAAAGGSRHKRHPVCQPPRAASPT